MNDDEDNWKEEILKLDEGYDMNQFLSYRKLPISKKLDYLEEVTEFFNKLTPEKNKRAWQKLKEEGF